LVQENGAIAPTRNGACDLPYSRALRSRGIKACGDITIMGESLERWKYEIGCDSPGRNAGKKNPENDDKTRPDRCGQGKSLLLF
jgi:hypothetical protein